MFAAALHCFSGRLGADIVRRIEKAQDILHQSISQSINAKMSIRRAHLTRGPLSLETTVKQCAYFVFVNTKVPCSRRNRLRRHSCCQGYLSIQATFSAIIALVLLDQAAHVPQSALPDQWFG